LLEGHAKLVGKRLLRKSAVNPQQPKPRTDLLVNGVISTVNGWHWVGPFVRRSVRTGARLRPIEPPEPIIAHIGKPSFLSGGVVVPQP
jgi:hypothetical protein